MKPKKHTQQIWWGAGIGLTALTVFLVVAKIHRKKSREKQSGKSLNAIDLSDFDSPDQPGSGQCMDKDFLRMLLRVEEKTGYPVFDWINSGARSAYWNKKVGGVSNSAHKIPTCKAADIKTRTQTIRNNIVNAAKEAGFKRIGIGKTFVHLDNDDSKRQYVAWGYPNGAAPPFNPFA